jgi:methylenetetrahydrofolate reductase (NADPH)
MPALAPVPTTPLPEAVARIASFMADFSVEATRPSDADIAAMAVLPRGTRVYVSAVPGRAAEESLSAAVRLRAAGFEPVPHVAVRNFASAQALDDFLARLTEEAQVHRVLVIAGDRAECGPLRRALDAIDSGVFRRRGIRAIGIAGYPDGHPKIGPEELRRALAEKIAAAEATGVAVEIVTQFCFDAQRMLDYVAQLRAYGFEQPVRVGLAGPTSLSSLLRYASRCGVRASAQALAQRAGLIRQVFALTVPDDLIRTLADDAAAQKGAQQHGVQHVSAHFFSFGGLGATARWTRAVADGRIALESASGFRVIAPGE